MSRFQPCAWCGEPGVTNVEVTPAIVRTHGNGGQGKPAVIKAATVVPACRAHRDLADRPTPPPLPAVRRKPGPEQTTVFDFLDTEAVWTA